MALQLFRGRLFFQEALCMNCFSSCNTWTVTAPIRLALAAGLIDERRLMAISSDRKLLSVRLIGNGLWWTLNPTLVRLWLYSCVLWRDEWWWQLWNPPRSPRVDYMIALQMTHLEKLWELLRVELGAELSTEELQPWKTKQNMYLGHFGKFLKSLMLYILEKYLDEYLTNLWLR